MKNYIAGVIRYRLKGSVIFLFLISGSVFAGLGQQRAASGEWEGREVDLRLGGGAKIKAVYYPKDKKDKLFLKDGNTTVRRDVSGSAAGRVSILSDGQFAANIVESPPVDGFVPWVTVSVTDAKKDVLELAAVASPVTGNFLTAEPGSDFGIGILDTGASSHIISYDDAERTGIYDAGLVTSNMIDIAGVTGSVSVWVSQPLGLFFDGLGGVDPCSLSIATGNQFGEYNVSVSVAPSYEFGVPTAIGTPFAVYYTAVIDVANQVTIGRGGQDFSGPGVRFYEKDDPAIPEYSDIIPLELRPLGGVDVEYIPTSDPEDPFNFIPQIPSTIIGNQSQSVFFVSSVDLYENANSALDKSRFMLDTGAQVTVIGSRIASRLRFNPDWPEFLVEVSGITGDVIEVPGFTVDQIVIPTLGDWFIANNVPVILLDVSSAEGGTLDGIIGMNLFTKFNMVLRGGGLFLQEDPTLEIELAGQPAGDIAPEGGDGRVDALDLDAFCQAWLSEGTIPPSANWNPKADLAPVSEHDRIVNFLDFAVLAGQWLEEVAP